MSRKSNQQDGAKVPAYIVTFSDMVTLLLTFFVMLLSLAKVQDPEMFNQSRDSFIESIDKMGLGTLFGSRPGPQFKKDRHHFEAESKGKPPGRMIDPDQERLRESIKKMSEMNNARNDSGSGTNVLATDILFPRGGSQLSGDHKESLGNIAQNLKKADGSVCLYIVGMPDHDASSNISVGAQRSQSAALYLKELIDNPAISIIAMGAESSWFSTAQNTLSSHLWIVISSSEYPE